jgi:CRISPR-associated endonuclease/helicase Cas3
VGAVLLYIAHTREDGKVQPLLEHLLGTADKSAKSASFFDKEALAYICGLLHDIGKYSKEFQDRIMNNGKLCDHSTAGAVFLRKHHEAIGNFLGYIITGHHSGLLNGGSWGSADTDKNLYGRFKKEIPNYDAYAEELDIKKYIDVRKLAMQISDIVRTREHAKGYSLSFLARMIFSCLVDADFLDTEYFIKNGEVERGIDHNFQDMEKTHIRYANSFVIDTFIKEKRRQILYQCLEKAEGVPGVYKLTVPTGGGKTISSMAFALRHIKYNPELRRIIYVIPFTSIIEQNAKVFSNILGDQYILEHHSNYDFDDTDDEEYNVKKLATENWDMPIVVTTNVQFFESIYGGICQASCRINFIYI